MCVTWETWINQSKVTVPFFQRRMRWCRASSPQARYLSKMTSSMDTTKYQYWWKVKTILFRPGGWSILIHKSSHGILRLLPLLQQNSSEDIQRHTGYTHWSQHHIDWGRLHGRSYCYLQKDLGPLPRERNKISKTQAGIWERYRFYENTHWWAWRIQTNHSKNRKNHQYVPANQHHRVEKFPRSIKSTENVFTGLHSHS